MLTRRRFLGAAAAALGTSALYAWRIEPHWVEIVRRPMPIVDLPTSLRGRTLLQLSDLHVGRVDPDYLVRSLQRAAALRPDIVAISGDLITRDEQWTPGPLADVIAHVPHGRLATVASLGNHDYGAHWGNLSVAAQVVAALTAGGVRVLRNETIDVAGLPLVGLADLWSPEFAPAATTLAALDPRRASIVLSHNPDSVDLPIWSNVRGWVLAGHTHGGQCKPPFLPPPVLPVRNRRYTAGVFDVGGGRTMYINRGLGHLLPVRFNVRPEMTLFTLTRA